VLLIEFPAESLPLLSRLRAFEKIWAKPFLVGESDLSVMVKDIEVYSLSKLVGRGKKIEGSQIDAACRQKMVGTGFVET
jgi:hypothetical protein